MKKHLKLAFLLAFSGIAGETCAQIYTPSGTVNSNTGSATNVGIGINAPKARLDVTGGSVLFNGNTGTLPDSGAGTRFMWIPSRAAVRFGQAVSNEWNAAKIGQYSFAGGWGSNAETESSFAFGENCHASGTGHSNIALGYGCVASGHVSVAIGDAATATGGGGAIAIGGFLTSATAGGAFAGGIFSQASGQNSTALAGGWADAQYSIAIGGSYTQGERALAIGTNSAYARAPYSVAVGYNVNITNKGAFVYGDFDSTALWPVVESNADNQFKVRSVGGFILHTDPDMTDDYSLFFKSGRLGIGVAAPAKKLHVHGEARIDTILQDTTLTRFLVADNNGVVKYRNAPAGGSDADWYKEGTTTPPVNINDNMYHLGNVAIGTASMYGKLNVNGGLTTYGTGLSGGVYDRFVLYTEAAGMVYDAPRAFDFSGASRIPVSWAWRGDATPSMQLTAAADLRLGTLSILPAIAVGKFEVRLSDNNKWNQFLFNGGGQARLLRIKGGSPDAQVSLVQVESNSLSGNDFTEDNIRFVIRGDGRVGVGTGTPIERFTVSGGNTAVISGNFIDRDLIGGGTTGASIDNSGNIIRTPSDMRLKENVNNLEGNLDKILKLRPVSYQYIDKEKYGTGYTLGFIAQEVEQILPQVVKRAADDYQLRSLNYVEIIPVLTGAIKEQQQQIEALKQELEAVKGRNDGLGSDPARVQAVLYQNVPNPFSHNTEIKYMLPENVNDARILVFDMNGKQIKSIPVRPGNGSVTISGSELSAGMYLYSLIANGQEIDTKRMILTD